MDFYSKRTVQLYHVQSKKGNSSDDVPYEFRPLCYELHGAHIKNRTIITFSEVKIYEQLIWHSCL